VRRAANVALVSSLTRAIFPSLLALTLLGCGAPAAPASATGTGGGSAVSTGGMSATGVGGLGAGGSVDASTSGAGGGAGGAGGEGTTGVSGSTGSTGSGGSVAVDPCLGTNPTCPSNAPASAGKGLVTINRCAFPMVDQDTWGAKGALVTALDAKLPVVSLADILLDLNRTAVTITGAQLPGGVTGFKSGFRWNDGDEGVAYWIPQGLTGSADATAQGTLGGHQVLLVASYYKKEEDPGSTVEKGVRLAVVDVSVSPPTYRFALLVDPVAGSPPTFAPITIHAGGIVWFEDYLYVADTSRGFRVFDLKHIFQVDTSKDTIGYDAATQTYQAHLYKYVIPQVDLYKHASACGPIFSFVALDRSSAPPSLISGEYCNGTTACGGALDGRLFRWPLDAATGRLAPPKTTYPANAYYAGQSSVQGGVAHAGAFYLSSSAPAGSGGALYVIPAGAKSTTFSWVNSPEDLIYDGSKKRIWGLSEAQDQRYVFSVDATKYP
jgi:hypothetical protein